MNKIGELNLYVGGILDFRQLREGWAAVHACQTIHYKRFGWSIHNRPPKDHPHYLMHESGQRMTLNWVDGGAHLYEWFGWEGMIRVLDFIDRQIKAGLNVLVHCDDGFSRSPTVALMYAAKRAKIISSLSYEQAKKDFLELYPKYSPGGIGDFVKANWDLIT